jgi:demethylmenaquinone methyltransferase/2-methoxy-6-polyprenyl-1,4-benzoquinol methylase
MPKTHFGFQEVELNKKEGLVQGVFSKVAQKYDLMNDIMSFGMHHSWKDELITELMPFAGSTLLDVAGGTGDIAQRFLKSGGGEVIVCDLNKEMLEEGKKKYPGPTIKWVHGNAQSLPFADDSFDYYTISFGIRNVSEIDKALQEAYRVLKPGGKFVCLELSNVANPLLRRFYDFYSFKIIPFIGGKITGDSGSYQYLVESVRRFPKALQFAKMIEDAGFDLVSFRKMAFGVVALHSGFKC